MSRISKKNFDRIASDALSTLHVSYPLPLTTRAIAVELARDKEFVKKVLVFLESKKLVVRVAGYERWVKWKLSRAANKKMDATSLQY